MFKFPGNGVAQYTIAQNDDLRVISKTVDGFPRISVIDSGGKKDHVVFQALKPGLFVNYIMPWRVWSPKRRMSGFLIAYEYGSGSSNLLTIVGPDKKGKWSELLHVDADDSYWSPPEFVDVLGDGIVDVLIKQMVSLSKSRNDIENYKVEDWRWSFKTGRYYLAAQTDYAHRFRISRSRE
jgi:hypothetical protein